MDEYKARLAFLIQSYNFAKRLELGRTSFNRSVERLKRAIVRAGPPLEEESRLHPLIEMMITRLAREKLDLTETSSLAGLTPAAINEAAVEVAKKIKLIRQRPPNANLRHHVEGLMALIQEFGGKPITASRMRDSVYDPHLSSGVSQNLKSIFRDLDPTVTETTLVNIVRDTRRKYAGKSMRFTDIFPLYGGGIDRQSGIPTAGPGHLITNFEMTAPIYWRLYTLQTGANFQRLTDY